MPRDGGAGAESGEKNLSSCRKRREEEAIEIEEIKLEP